MCEWTQLKQFNFEDRTVSIARSNIALRKWRCDTEFKCGGKNFDITENEKVAWQKFYTECRDALEAEEARHQ